MGGLSQHRVPPSCWVEWGHCRISGILWGRIHHRCLPSDKLILKRVKWFQFCEPYFAISNDKMPTFLVTLVKDLSMMYRALWDRRHEVATRISRIRVAPEYLWSHNARYIMLKSDYNMNYLVLIHYEAEIYKWSSDAGGGESCIVKKSMHGFVGHVHSNAFVTS